MGVVIVRLVGVSGWIRQRIYLAKLFLLSLVLSLMTLYGSGDSVGVETRCIRCPIPI